MRSVTLLVFVLGFSYQNLTLANTEPNTNKSDKYVIIPDESFERALKKLGYDKNINGKVKRKNVCGIKKLNLRHSWITDLSGIEAFTAITDLTLNGGCIKSLDLSKNIALKSLNLISPFRSGCITSLNLSKNTALTELYCNGNKLTSLDLSKNTALTKLNCSFNQLTSLDVSQNTNLTSLVCYNNNLTSLDLSKNTALTILSCSDNQLTSLDVSNNTALTILSCSDNQLTSLDISNNTALERLDCNGNQLTSLDVSNNTALTELYCNNNQLTSLDVSNTALTKLSCNNNQLTSLDVSNIPEFVDCSENILDCELLLNKNSALTLEEQPQFPGGMEKLLEFLITNIKYPELAVKQGIQGKVFVAFVVNKNGKIRDAKIVRGVHESLDKEALRVISIMPNWNPGKQNGEAINCRFTLPISFKFN